MRMLEWKLRHWWCVCFMGLCLMVALFEIASIYEEHPIGKVIIIGSILSMGALVIAGCIRACCKMHIEDKQRKADRDKRMT